MPKMTFHKKFQIEDIASYKAYPNYLLYAKGCLKNKQVYLNDICLNKGVTNYFLFKEKVLYNKWNLDDSFIYNTSQKTTIEVKNSRVFSSVGNTIIYKNNDEYVYKNRDFKTIFIGKNRFYLISKNFGIANSIDSILAENFNNEILWELRLSQLGKPKYENEVDQLNKIIGIAYNNIWFTTKGGRLVAIDTIKGNISKKYSIQEYDIKFGYESTLVGTNLFLNEIDKNIYGMSANCFQKIDAYSNEITESFDFREKDVNGMGSYEYVFSPLLQGDYFTFLGEKKHTDGIRFIGLYDYRKRKLVWEYELISREDCKNGNKLIIPERVHLSGNKLHVKDFKGSLHIFEKN